MRTTIKNAIKATLGLLIIYYIFGYRNVDHDYPYLIPIVDTNRPQPKVIYNIKPDTAVKYKGNWVDIE